MKELNQEIKYVKENIEEVVDDLLEREEFYCTIFNGCNIHEV